MSGQLRAHKERPKKPVGKPAAYQPPKEVIDQRSGFRDYLRDRLAHCKVTDDRAAFRNELTQVIPKAAFPWLPIFLSDPTGVKRTGKPKRAAARNHKTAPVIDLTAEPGSSPLVSDKKLPTVNAAPANKRWRSDDEALEQLTEEELVGLGLLATEQERQEFAYYSHQYQALVHSIEELRTSRRLELQKTKERLRLRQSAEKLKQLEAVVTPSHHRRVIRTDAPALACFVGIDQQVVPANTDARVLELLRATSYSDAAHQAVNSLHTEFNRTRVQLGIDAENERIRLACKYRKVDHEYPRSSLPPVDATTLRRTNPLYNTAVVSFARQLDNLETKEYLANTPGVHDTNILRAELHLLTQRQICEREGLNWDHTLQFIQTLDPRDLGFEALEKSDSNQYMHLAIAAALRHPKQTEPEPAEEPMSTEAAAEPATSLQTASGTLASAEGATTL